MKLSELLDMMSTESSIELVIVTRDRAVVARMNRGMIAESDYEDCDELEVIAFQVKGTVLALYCK